MTEVSELTPARALRILTPPGIALSSDLVHPRVWRAGGPMAVGVRLGWKRRSAGARRVAKYIDYVAAELLGPDAPERVRKGEIASPLREGEIEYPADPAYAGCVFMDIAGDSPQIVDLRADGAQRELEVSWPGVTEFVGPGSTLTAAAYLYVFKNGVLVQLKGLIGVKRGAPGWEFWDPASAAPSG